MSANLLVKVEETIRRHCMLSPGDSILVAVSGGPDSVALLHLLAGLKEKLHLRLAIAHLQHGIRGDEGREDALFVSGMAEKLGIPCHLKEVDLPTMKSSNGRGNLEAMGREERYRFFAGLAEERGFQKIAVGHTRDDQAETILMRLLRGSGKRGLAGIPPVRPLALGGRRSKALLIRPLMESTREEIVRFLIEEKVSYCIDRSTLDPAFLRNWVRLILLPQLRERAGAGLDERLARLSEIWRDEEIFLERLTGDRLSRLLQRERLDRAVLLEEPKAIQRRFLRRWIERVLGNLNGIGFGHVESALSFAHQGPSQGRLSLPRGLELVREYDWLSLERRGAKKAEPRCYSYNLPMDGELLIPEAGVRLRSSRSAHSLYCGAPQDGLEAHFDQAQLPGALTVRNFQPGDRFRPFGMRGHKKVKDLFIEKKVPFWRRRSFPILVAAGEILWIPGCGRSDRAPVTPDTREILKIMVEIRKDVSSDGDGALIGGQA
jgi:tRNA(Ile)-lysidine synthase